MMQLPNRVTRARMQGESDIIDFDWFVQHVNSTPSANRRFQAIPEIWGEAFHLATHGFVIDLNWSILMPPYPSQGGCPGYRSAF